MTQLNAEQIREKAFVREKEKSGVRIRKSEIVEGGPMRYIQYLTEVILHGSR